MGPGECVSEGATGYGTQLVLKYLFNFVNGKTDINEEDHKTPVDEKPVSANVNLTEQVKQDNEVSTPQQPHAITTEEDKGVTPTTEGEQKTPQEEKRAEELN
jgi:hypothetical protein